MKKIYFWALGLSMFLLLLSPLSSTEARTVRVKSYYKPSSGTYINSYYRTSPNSYKFDNYSSKGNYNPYTGKAGTKNYYGW
jgi:hypothetical protein